jgi:hypothetical protein
MSHFLRGLSCLILSNALASCALPASAQEAGKSPADQYPLSGKVLASSSAHGHFYQVATEGKIYLLMCEHAKGFHMGLPECKSGDKPIADGDTIPFRVDGDSAYVPVAKGGEDELRILTAELKVIPPLKTPAASESAAGSAAAANTELSVVIGTGTHIQGQKKVGWSTNPFAGTGQGFSVAGAPSGITMASPTNPVIASGPVMATPVTGGPPVMVIPTGPVGGGVVTGIPTTGGAPIMAIPTGPVMGTPVGGAPRAGGVAVGGGSPPWVHLLRVKAGDKVYMLECSRKPCEVDKKPIGLGDTIVIRAEKKWAYVSLGGGAEQKFKILGETDEPDETDKAETETKPAPDTK